MLRVGVVGALGRMGVEVVSAALGDPDLELAAVIDSASTAGQKHPACGLGVLEELAGLDPSSVEVLVDFTVADSAVRNIDWALDHGVHAVVGTTGIPDSEIERISAKADGASSNVLIAPNFAIGAVVMMKLARIAAPSFDQCEIVELHHRGKKDAPSGTALATARAIEQASHLQGPPESTSREVTGTRGGRLGPVSIHSVRLDGFVAHQEVIFGAQGQTLSIRHDTTDRSCFMPGVLLAVKKVGELPGLTLGLEGLV
jgi:4-hydroxy-tetrahydrodipicolinate reductase